MNNVTTDYCIDIIKKFEVSEENKVKNVLGIEGKITSSLSFFFFFFYSYVHTMFGSFLPPYSHSSLNFLIQSAKLNSRKKF
jgi:hypothetical protein